MPTAASAATKSAASAPKRSAPPQPRAKAPANARISAGSTIDRRLPMKRIHYSKYTGDDLGIGAEELLNALSDFLLESGFNTQYMPFSEWNQHTLEDLKKAIQQALESGQMFSDDAMQEMMQRLQQMTPEQVDKLLEKLVQKMVDEGQITIEEPSDRPASAPGTGRSEEHTSELQSQSNLVCRLLL